MRQRNIAWALLFLCTNLSGCSCTPNRGQDAGEKKEEVESRSQAKSPAASKSQEKSKPEQQAQDGNGSSGNGETQVKSSEVGAEGTSQSGEAPGAPGSKIPGSGLSGRGSKEPQGTNARTFSPQTALASGWAAAHRIAAKGENGSSQNCLAANWAQDSHPGHQLARFSGRRHYPEELVNGRERFLPVARDGP